VKHLTFLFFLLCSAFCWAASASSDYSVDVHVSATRLVRDTRSVGRYQALTVTIEGKKYELESLDYPNALLMLGDYKARLAKDQHWTGPYDSYRVYEFLFPDNKKRQFLVVGQSE
jgi:hypothetical protein